MSFDEEYRDEHELCAHEISTLQARIAALEADLANHRNEVKYCNGDLAFLRSRIAALEAALDQSVQLQSHYANLLNAYDGGERMSFSGGEAWLKRLAALAADAGETKP